MRLRSILFVFMFCLLEASASAQCTSTLEQEYQALMELYQSTNGAGWTNKTGWSAADPNTVQSVVGWHGIITNSEGRVVSLVLTGNNLIGAIPATIGDLCYLQSLKLNSNQINGAIPSSIGNLRNMNTLDLWGNHLTGSIPEELFDLTGLTRLELENNSLTGSISSSVGDLVNLINLDLSSNQLTGSIPECIGNLVSLQTLNLRINQLTGPIPSTIGNLSALSSLKLANNQLSGPIPPSIGNLESVTVLGLGANQLSGNIPEELYSLTALRWLELQNNSFTGAISSTLGSLANITYIDFSTNQLNGSIPASIGNLTNLQTINARFNQLSGSIPVSIGDLSNLTSINLDNNLLTGSIPASIGSIPNLLVLRLWANQLSGSIPPEIGNLVKLTNLELSNNQLSGQVPSSLGNLTNLKVLDVSFNQLSGSLPGSLQNLTRLSSVNLRRNQLTGVLPVQWIGTGPLANTMIDYNKFSFSDFLSFKQTNSGGFAYAPQNLIDEEKTVNAPSGQSLTLTTSIDRNTSPESVYQWFKVVNGGTPTALNTPSASGHTVVIENVSEADAGTKYYYTITNTAAPGLTLKSHDQTLQLITCTTPTLDFQSEELNGTHTFTPVFTGENCTPTFTWDFGDGTTSQDQAANHGYTATGTFTVTLTVSYDCGACPSGQLIITHEVIIENGFCGSIYCDEVGGVGIGTRNTEGFRLSVNGKIRASDIIKVYPQHQWSDFVFEKDYRLRPLNEVESFIKENGHLPEIPSAKEVETQGIDLGAMDAKLLQKVEELTLYIIRQEKKMEALQKEVNELRNSKKAN